MQQIKKFLWQMGFSHIAQDSNEEEYRFIFSGIELLVSDKKDRYAFQWFFRGTFLNRYEAFDPNAISYDTFREMVLQMLIKLFRLFSKDQYKFCKKSIKTFEAKRIK